jgi:alpha-D-xyloside xylohydrolase
MNKIGFLLGSLIGILILTSCNEAKFEQSAEGVEIALSASKTDGIQTLRLNVVSENTIQVLASATDTFSSRKSLSVIEDGRKPVEFTVKQEGKTISVSTTKLRVSVQTDKGTIEFFDKDQNSLLLEKERQLEYVDAPMDKYYNIEQQFSLGEAEAIYGLGQINNGVMNYRGHKELLMQTNHHAVNPFILSSKGYGILWDNYSETQFDNETDPGSMVLRSEVADEINYYFIHADNSDGIIAEYRKLTGHAPLFGKWAYGYWQSKERYESQAQILSAAIEYRERRIPIDNIIQDWEYWGENGWNAMIFDKKYFPDPEAMIREIHDLNYHYMITIWPGSDKKTDIYKEIKAAGYAYDNIVADGGYICDMFSPECGDIFWSHMKKNLFDKGVDAWWLDGTEPAVNNEFYPYCIKHELINNGVKNEMGTFRRYLNPYSLVESGHIYRNQRAVTDQKRVFMLSRSGFTGQQRYGAATWSGDINSTWEVLQFQVPAGLNFCMSGLPYWTSDIGGFFAEEFLPEGAPHEYIPEGYKELYVRWFQYGAFCPLFRSHGTFYPREVWRFGEPGSWPYDALLKATNLRYRLFPYIYSLAWRVTHEGYTIMRGLPFVFPEDELTYEITDQFMFGDAFLVNPVLESVIGKDIKPVPIPASNFFNPDGEPGLLAVEPIEMEEDEDEASEEPDQPAEGEQEQEAEADESFMKDAVSAADHPGNWEEWDICFAMGCNRLSGQILTDEAGSYELYLNKFGGDVILSPFNVELRLEELETGEKASIENLKANTKYRITVDYCAEGDFNELYWITPDQRENAPVNKQTREVYLPAGNNWVDFWTGSSAEGGQRITVDAPMDRIPLYVKAGTILPMGPFIQYSDEKPADPIQLRIYKGADAEFELYEDENDSYNYEKGVYSTIKFVWNEEEQKLTIGKREGEFPGMLEERTFQVTWVSEDHGCGVEINAQPDQVIKYKGEEIEIQM